MILPDDSYPSNVSRGSMHLDSVIYSLPWKIAQATDLKIATHQPLNFLFPASNENVHFETVIVICRKEFHLSYLIEDLPQNSYFSIFHSDGEISKNWEKCFRLEKCFNQMKHQNLSETKIVHFLNV